METPRVLIRTAPAYEPEPGDVAAAVRSVPGRAPDGTGRVHVVPEHAASPPQPPARRDVEVVRDLRVVAVRAITLILEVLDRRRGVAQLEPTVSAVVRDQIGALVRLQGVRPVGNSSTVRRVHVQMCDHRTSAEVFGSLTCGTRMRAFAGRIERRPCRVRAPGAHRPGTPRVVEYRWQLVAFTIV